MLEGNIIVLKYLQHPAAEADLRIHHRLVNINGAEAFSSSDAGDGVVGPFAGVFYDHRAGIAGTVGVADIDGDPFFSYRENGVLMENAGAHIG